jgi:hypothetical protein
MLRVFTKDEGTPRILRRMIMQKSQLYKSDHKPRTRILFNFLSSIPNVIIHFVFGAIVVHHKVIHASFAANVSLIVSVHWQWSCGVPSSSHKQEVAGSIPAGCTKTSSLFCCYFTDWCHTLTFGTIYPSTKIRTWHRSNKQARPAHVEKKKGLPLQSTGEERKEEINSTVQLVTCQYWYKL